MASGRRPRTTDISTESPANNPQSRELQLMNLAFNRVEQRILNNEASAAELVHFLKLASKREDLEREKLEADVELRKAQLERERSAVRTEELYQNALQAMRAYSGNPDSGGA